MILSSLELTENMADNFFGARAS